MNRLFSVFLLSLLSQPFFAQYQNLAILELDSIATSLAAEQKYDQAIDYSEAAIQKAKTTLGPIDTTYALVLNNLGVIYYNMYRDQEAGFLFEQVAHIYKQAYGPINKKYAEAWESVGVIESSLKNFEKAEYIYKEVEPIYKQLYGEQSEQYAFLLGNFAVLYDNWNREELAESMYLRSIDIEKQILGENDINHALSLHNFAVFYGRYGHNQKALGLHKKALAIYKKNLGTKHGKYAHALVNIGVTYTKLGSYAKAKSLFIEALDINAQIHGKKHQRYAYILSQLGVAYILTSEYKKAEQLYLESLSIYETDATITNQKITPLLKLTSFYSQTKHLEKTLEYGFKAIKLNSMGEVDDSDLTSLLRTASQFSFKNPEIALQTIHYIAKAFYAEYEKDSSLQYLAQSQQCYKALLGYMNHYRTQFAFNRDKFRVLKKMFPIVEGEIKTLLTLNKHDHKKDYFLEVFKLMEQNKSILLMDALQSQKSNTFGNLPDSLLQKEQDLMAEFDKLKKAKLTSIDSNKLKSISKQMNQLNTKISTFKNNLKATFPKYHALNYSPKNIDIKAIQKLLKPKEILVEYFIGDKQFYIFSITPNTIDCKVLPYDHKKTQDLVDQFRAGLSDYYFISNEPQKAFQEFCRSSHALYQLLLHPLEKELQHKDQLTIIPDGILGHIPFETLLSDNFQDYENFAQAPYLIKKYKIRYSYSAALLAENYKSSTQLSNNKVLAIAATYDTPVDSNLLAQGHRTYKDLSLRKVLRPLPAVLKEIQMLSEQFDGQFVDGEKASEAFFKENATPYGVIHLAMHGILDWNHPILSNMAFTENHDSLNDNFLYTFEISKMKLHADLVVLSACETGYGKFKQGEGILSLARSFMYADVPSLVVSLWQVNDASTAQIMNNFYQNLAQKQDKATALQNAKLDYLKNAKGLAAHPAFWAPFIQLGNSEPINIKTKASPILWYIFEGIGVLGILVTLFLIRKRKK
ncbi:MAG: CHAT domain-containing protein [Aureispira sp.]|nr:CHAT domain-containing protein [Aureispira sp.]